MPAPGPDSGLANQSLLFPCYSDSSRGRHVTQVIPMKLCPRTFAATVEKEKFSLYGGCWDTGTSAWPFCAPVRSIRMRMLHPLIQPSWHQLPWTRQSQEPRVPHFCTPNLRSICWLRSCCWLTPTLRQSFHKGRTTSTGSPARSRFCLRMLGAMESQAGVQIPVLLLTSWVNWEASQTFSFFICKTGLITPTSQWCFKD